MGVILDPRFVPTLSVVLNLASACRYAVAGDWGRVVYWLAAATLTTSLTYWIGR